MHTLKGTEKNNFHHMFIASPFVTDYILAALDSLAEYFCLKENLPHELKM